jgi:hypothetical protein
MTSPAIWPIKYVDTHSPFVGTLVLTVGGKAVGPENGNHAQLKIKNSKAPLRKIGYLQRYGQPSLTK